MKPIIEHILRNVESNMISNNQKLVIYMLSSFMGEKMTCFPSHEELARVCSISIKTVQRTLKSLEKMNILFIKRSHNKNNIYSFNPSWMSIFDELGVKLGILGRQSVQFGASQSRPGASQSRTNIINNIINNNNDAAHKNHKQDQKQIAKFWEPGNPDYDRVNKRKDLN